jgi:hypothetical protein
MLFIKTPQKKFLFWMIVQKIQNRRGNTRI